MLLYSDSAESRTSPPWPGAAVGASRLRAMTSATAPARAGEARPAATRLATWAIRARTRVADARVNRIARTPKAGIRKKLVPRVPRMLPRELRADRRPASEPADR